VDDITIIKNIMSELTKGFTKDDKLSFLTSIGISNFNEIKEYSQEQLNKLIGKLQRMREDIKPKPSKDMKIYPNETVVDKDHVLLENGYVVRRGKTPRECSFRLPK
jgi:superfamily I DNA and/or RNA helicase